MTGKELATQDAVKNLLAANPSKFATDVALATVSSSGYLPYIQLFGANSQEVKRGEFPMGHFGLNKGKDNRIDLGDEFVGFFLSWRPKAMVYKPEVLSFFDPSAEAFKKIQAEADEPNSNKGFGAEFLVWLPQHKEFATYFLGNKTGRNEAPNLIGPMTDTQGPLACIQKAKLIETARYSWHGPSTLPFDLDIDPMPEVGALANQLEKFNNPPVAVKEVDTEEDR